MSLLLCLLVARTVNTQEAGVGLVETEHSRDTTHQHDVTPIFAAIADPSLSIVSSVRKSIFTPAANHVSPSASAPPMFRRIIPAHAVHPRKLADADAHPLSAL
jgi:hypothetical protein